MNGCRIRMPVQSKPKHDKRTNKVMFCSTMLRSQAEFFMGGIIPVASQPGNCTICCDPLDTDVVSTVVCQHSFHLTCVLDWFQSSAPQRGSCPNCRQELYEPEPLSVPQAAVLSPLRRSPSIPSISSPLSYRSESWQSSPASPIYRSGPLSYDDGSSPSYALSSPLLSPSDYEAGAAETYFHSFSPTAPQYDPDLPESSSPLFGHINFDVEIERNCIFHGYDDLVDDDVESYNDPTDHGNDGGLLEYHTANPQHTPAWEIASSTYDSASSDYDSEDSHQLAHVQSPVYSPVRHAIPPPLPPGYVDLDDMEFEDLEDLEDIENDV
ncbi:hypothetical protein FB567DRAFT_545250 [Paraphoma chrysanthemicola]|uniref:RING-type domain-containing protein n=1 Tax=Paraphoma chrysanthemicola TaxID=798071 RepID=A0A8K0W1P6_9PLEO|nr:hypothetical protein FB567DRAFT_545250 [Paraphoma chrysanthemicola]